MDKWASLEPVRLYDSTPTTAQGRTSISSAANKLLGRSRPKIPSQPYIGPLPIDIHVVIASHLPITAIPSYARASRATAALCRDERIWQRHWQSLGIESFGFSAVLDRLKEDSGHRGGGPATMHVMEQDVIDDEDDFGAFASASARPHHNATTSASFGATDFVPFNQATAPASDAPPKTSYKQLYMQAHLALKPTLPALLAAPHLILPTLFPSSDAETAAPQSSTGARSSYTLRDQSHILHLLALFLSPTIQPVLAWPSLLSALKAAIDRFEASLLAAFDTADRRGNEDGMKDAAWASWEVFEGRGEWEMGKLWAEKKEIFYESGKWDSAKNITYAHLGVVGGLNLPDAFTRGKLI